MTVGTPEIINELAPPPPKFEPEGRCAVCDTSFRGLIEGYIKKGMTFSGVTRVANEAGFKISRQTILRHYEHASERLAAERQYELRNVARNPKDLAILVRDKTVEAIENGNLQVTKKSWRNVAPGLRAQQLLDQREQHKDFNETQRLIAGLLSGALRPGLAGPPERLLLEEGQMIDAEYVEVR